MPDIHLSHNFEQRMLVARILHSALEAVNSTRILPRFVKLDGARLSVPGRVYELAAFRHIHVLSLGKAALPMAYSLEELIGGRLQGRLVITKNAGGYPKGALEVIEAGHPVPDERSLRAGQAALDFLQEIRADDLLICAISGGGSALLAAPRPPAAAGKAGRLRARASGAGGRGR